MPVRRWLYPGTLRRPLQSFPATAPTEDPWRVATWYHTSPIPRDTISRLMAIKVTSHALFSAQKIIVHESRSLLPERAYRPWLARTLRSKSRSGKGRSFYCSVTLYM
jgi:hypothetical protein